MRIADLDPPLAAPRQGPSEAAPQTRRRAIAVERLVEPVGDVGPQVLDQIREILADLLEL